MRTDKPFNTEERMSNGKEKKETHGLGNRGTI